jgi:hypothetical protein
MRNKFSTALAMVGLSLALPAVASAKDICVMSVSSCPAADTYTSTGTGLQAALDAAAASPGADRVLVGAGKFTAPTGSGFQYTDKSAPVEIAGAGSAKTSLEAPPDAPATLYLHGGSGSTVHDLAIAVPASTKANSYPDGVDLLNASADHVAVTSDPANPRALGVAIAGGSFTNGSVSVAMQGGGGIHADNGVTLSDTSISGYEGLSVGGSHLRAQRLTITAAAGVYAQGADAVIEDSLIHSTSPTDGGVSLSVFYKASVDLTLLHDTIVASQSGGVTGVYARTDNGGEATITVSGSVIHGFAHDRYAWGEAGKATIVSDHSSYDPAGDVTKTGNGGAASVSVAGGNGDLNAAPGFVDPANGDYHLAAGSALIDAGDPADVSARRLDGDGDCSARIDIGAFEYRPPQPVVKAAATGAPVAGGAAAHFSAAGSCASDPSEALTYGWSFDDGSSAGGAEVAHAFTTAGLHHATLTVTDGGGHSGTAAVAIEVAPSPATPGQQGGPGPASAPKITKVAVVPHRFRSRRSTTARVRFAVDRKASVRVSIVGARGKTIATHLVNVRGGKSVVRLTRKRLARGKYRVVVRAAGAQSSAAARFAVTR